MPVVTPDLLFNRGHNTNSGVVQTVTG